MRNTTTQRRTGRTSLLLLLLLVLLTMPTLMMSCGSKEDGKAENTAPKESNGIAPEIDSTATAMYQLFIDGRLAEYVNQVESNDSKPEEYRQQMEILLKQRLVQMKAENGGPVRCRLQRFEPRGDNYGTAFIEVTYRNKTKEVILQQMVKVDGRWRIR